MDVNYQFILFKAKCIIYANLRNIWRAQEWLVRWVGGEVCCLITEFLFLWLEKLGWHRALTGLWIFMGTVKNLACTDRIHSIFLMAIISQVLIMFFGCIRSTWHLRSKNNYGRHMKVIYIKLA